jgi:hypothetical protein
MNREQFRAILWLRWRLTRNQLTRGSGFGAVIAALAGAMLVLLAVGTGTGATLLGALALKNASATAVMFVWDGVVFVVLLFSLIAVLTELQRSESVDLTRLLHLPIGLKQVFVFNYLASLISLGTVLALAIMLGLAVGLVISQGPLFLLAAPLVLAFVFMVTAWIYCLRGWLLSFMVNPRRRRAIIMWITLGVILVGQSPQLIHFVVPRKGKRDREAQPAAQKQSAGQTNHSQTATGVTPDAQNASAALPNVARDEKKAQTIAIARRANQWVPLLWLPNGARGLAAGELLPALWGGAGMFALGWLGLSRAYHATVKFYRGDEPVKAVAVKATPSRSAKPASNWVARRLPWLPEDAAALALAQFRSMTRAPEVRMMLAMGLFMAIFLPAMIFWRGGSNVNIPEAARPFVGTGVTVMALFMILQLVCNQFGCDRDGFRGLVLLPTPRERVLLGKNAALLPLATLIALVPMVAVSVLAKLPPVVVLATVLQFTAAFLMYCAIGNLASILAPYRIAAGSLKPTKQSWQTSLMVMLVHLSFPLVIWPVFIPPALGLGLEQLGGLPAGLVNLLAALLLTGAFGALYALTLRPLGRLLQRRETKILHAVTEVRE